MSHHPINNWWVEASPLFATPELRGMRLVGDVAGRAGVTVTSRIVKAEGRLVTTRTGSVYELGAPAPEYLEQLRIEGIAYDEAQPIKVAR